MSRADVHVVSLRSVGGPLRTHNFQNQPCSFIERKVEYTGRTC
jgi:hypothetical protein